jgi:hypothetical protein
MVDVGAHYGHAQIIRCDIKPGSVERSTDLETEGAPQQRTRI